MPHVCSLVWHNIWHSPWDTVIDITGLIGSLCVALVAWRADKYGYWIARLRASKPIFKDAARAKNIQKTAEKSLEQTMTERTYFIGLMVRCGVLLSVLSYVLAISKVASGN